MLDKLKNSKNSLKKLYKINRKGYFYPVTKSNSMNRMNLSQLINFLVNNNLPQTASFFAGCANDSVTVDGLIEAYFVRKHVGEGQLLREIQASVTTYLGCDK